MTPEEYLAGKGEELLTYVLNLSGTFIGVLVTFAEFLEGLRVYALAGFLMFVCILPVMLVSIIGILYVSKKQEA